MKALSDPILTFRGSFTPSRDGAFSLRFVTRNKGSELRIDGTTYRQESDFEFLTVRLNFQRGVAIPFTLTSTYRNPGFRVLEDDFPDERVTRRVYLPRSTKWFDFWTGSKVDSGEVEAAAGLSKIPLYVRAGSIVPLQVEDNAGFEGPITELRIYRGENGSLDLYGDAGDGYAYQSGQQSSIPIQWDESRGTLTLRRRGAYPGMPVKQRFQAV